MASRWERGSDKKLVEKHQKILKDLLALPGNKICVDCKKRDPRWASANLGVFMCLRCSGVHRSLGVHISKVRSVDLDTWTQEHVETMQRWGNARANLYWEFGLEAGHVPDDARVESFIRNKYEYKKFVKPGPMPEPETLAGENSIGTAPVSHQQQSVAPTAEFPRPPTVNASNYVATSASAAKPVVDDWAAFSAAPSQPPPPVPRVSAPNPPTMDLFGGMVPPAPSGVLRPPTQQQQQQPAQQSSGIHLMQTQGDLKKDILSLYSNNSTQQSQPSPQTSAWANAWASAAPTAAPAQQPSSWQQPQQTNSASPGTWAAAWSTGTSNNNHTANFSAPLSPSKSNSSQPDSSMAWSSQLSADSTKNGAVGGWSTAIQPAAGSNMWK